MTSYVAQILHPDEHILYQARIHPVIYLPGILTCLFALFLGFYLKELEYTWTGAPPSMGYSEYLAAFNQWMGRQYYALISNWPSMRYLTVGGPVVLLIIGVGLLIRAYVLATYTELVITAKRIIAKFGFTNITTAEVDRWKIAEVVIRQTVFGRMLNYGKIHLRGFAGSIDGLPPISEPYELRKHISSRYEW